MEKQNGSRCVILSTWCCRGGCALCSHVCCWRVLEQIAELDSSGRSDADNCRSRQTGRESKYTQQLAASLKCFLSRLQRNQLQLTSDVMLQPEWKTSWQFPPRSHRFQNTMRDVGLSSVVLWHRAPSSFNVQLIRARRLSVVKTTLTSPLTCCYSRFE